jgi:hypothetical protein
VSVQGTVPCEAWDVIWPCDLTGIGPTVTGQALQAASEVLWALTGQRFGLCSQTLRPCRRECQGMLWPAGSSIWPNIAPGMTYPLPFWWNGQWLNLTCGSCTTDCSCSSVSEVTLPAPVYDIVTVKIDGVVVTGGYRVDDNRLLVKTNGTEWPLCNDLSKNDTEVGTWSVTARFGETLPTLGKMAVGELACEFIKAIQNDDSCALPQPVQSVARQGVSITYLDANEAFAQGRVGLRIADMFISTYNPGALRQRARVYNVDGAGIRRAGT